MEERLACTSDPLSARDVVRIHRVMALGAFFAQDDARARAAVAGMLAVEAAASFPEDLVPQGSKLAILRDEGIQASHTAGPALVALGDGWIEVNGVFAPHVQEGVAATLQRLDTQGVVVETRFWWPGDSLGDWASTGAEATESAEAKDSARRREEAALKRLAAEATRQAAASQKASLPRGKSGPTSETDKAIARENATARHIALTGGAALGGVATGIIYFLAADAESRALDGEVPTTQAEVYRDQANSLTWAWIGTSVLATGCVATLAITW